MLRDRTLHALDYGHLGQISDDQGNNGIPRTRSLPAGHTIWHEGEGHAPVVGMLRSGILRLVRHNRDGRRQIVNLVLPGEVFGQDQFRRTGYALETATEASVQFFDRAAYSRRFASDPDFRRRIYKQEARALDRLRAIALAIGGLRPEERIAAFLSSAKNWMPYEPQPDGTGILSLNISRRDLADLLATSTETICRTLKKFERTGWIKMYDAKHLRIHDRSDHLPNAATFEFA